METEKYHKKVCICVSNNFFKKLKIYPNSQETQSFQILMLLETDIDSLMYNMSTLKFKKLWKKMHWEDLTNLRTSH